MMRIAAFGDIHMETGFCEKEQLLRSADLLLLSGDLTHFGKTPDAEKVIEAIRAVNANILAQIGNLDHFEINEFLEKLHINMHGQAHLIKHGEEMVCIIGLGGSNPTPFGTPTEFHEEVLHEILTNSFTQAKFLIKDATAKKNCTIPIILVSHTPPKGTITDLISNGQHVGSTAVFDCIKNYQPDLCITGHIHEAKGIDTIGTTPVCNPGMFNLGGWVDIHIKKAKLTFDLK